MASFVTRRPRFVLFGDSLTELSHDSDGGWGAALQHAYARKVDVVNRGFSGYNSRYVLPILDEVFEGTTADNTLLVTVFLGANDAAKADGPAYFSRQHVPVHEYKENLRKIVAHVKSLGVANVLLLTPPPVYDLGRKKAEEERTGQEVAEGTPLDRTNAFVQNYAVACKEVASELGLPVVDTWTAIQEEANWETTMFYDGLHFTGAGNQAVYRAVTAVLDKEFPNISAQALLSQYPSWEDVNPTDPASSMMPKGSK